MQTQRINITLPNDIAKDLRRTIPARARSKFIAQALEERLKRKKNLKKDLMKSLRAQKEIIREIQEDFRHVDAEASAKLP